LAIQRETVEKPEVSSPLQLCEKHLLALQCAAKINFWPWLCHQLPSALLGCDTGCRLGRQVQCVYKYRSTQLQQSQRTQILSLILRVPSKMCLKEQYQEIKNIATLW